MNNDNHDRTFKKFDTYALTTYFVRLATDPKVFTRDDQGEDVVLTFCDNSRVEATEELWVDARVHGYHNDLAKVLRKGDVVQIQGKLRFKKNNDGNYRGKIYDAKIATYAGFERGIGMDAESRPVAPSFK